MSDCHVPLFVRQMYPDGEIPYVPPPCSQTRHGHVDWHDLSPLEALVMLAAMIDQSDDRSDRELAPRHASYLGILGEMRRRFDPLERWDGEAIGEAIYSLRNRGALAIRPGAVEVLAWPVPGGAPW